MRHLNNIVKILEEELVIKIREVQEDLYEKGGPADKFYELKKLIPLYEAVLNYTGKVIKPDERY